MRRLASATRTAEVLPARFILGTNDMPAFMPALVLAAGAMCLFCLLLCQP
jgi:hypothetical protein